MKRKNATSGSVAGSLVALASGLCGWAAVPPEHPEPSVCFPELHPRCQTPNRNSRTCLMSPKPCRGGTTAFKRPRTSIRGGSWWKPSMNIKCKFDLSSTLTQGICCLDQKVHSEHGTRFFLRKVEICISMSLKMDLLHWMQEMHSWWDAWDKCDSLTAWMLLTLQLEFHSLFSSEPFSSAHQTNADEHVFTDLSHMFHQTRKTASEASAVNKLAWFHRRTEGDSCHSLSAW